MPITYSHVYGENDDDPEKGIRTRCYQETGFQPLFATASKIFVHPDPVIKIKNMTIEEQYDFLKLNREHDEVTLDPKRAGKVAGYFRMYVRIGWLKLGEVFAIIEPGKNRRPSKAKYPEIYKFFNEDLRDFLNYSENGADDYKWKDVKAKDSGWCELPSVMSQMHQTNADDDPTKLNAKFVHDDGREAVFNCNRMLVTDELDKGTFNYDPRVFHPPYDMAPYEDRYRDRKRTNRCQPVPFVASVNSMFWGMSRAEYEKMREQAPYE